MEFIEKKAGELYISSSGLSKPADQFGFGYPFLSYSDIFHNYYVPDELKTLVNSNEKDRKTCSVERGDVFLTRTSETTDELGMSCVALKTIEGATFNGFAKRLRPLTDEIVPEYAAYYFRSSYFRGQCMSMASLITRASLNDGMISRLRIRYPKDRHDQEHIGNMLMNYDKCIANNNKRIKILEQMAENLYKEWFVRFRFPGHEDVELEGGKPINWELLRLEDFGITLESGSRPSGGIDDAIEDGVPSLGAEAVNGLAEFDYSSVKLVPHEFYEKLKRGKNKGNHILVYKDGAYIGKVTIFRNEFPYKEYAINEHVFFLNAVDSEYQNYLYFTLHQDAYFNTMQNLNRNAAQPGLSKLDMNRIKITVPEKKVIKKFNEIVEPIFEEVFKLAKCNSYLIKQRDLLLPRLMSGKLEVK